MVSPRGNRISTVGNAELEQQVSRARKRREQRIRAAAWRAATAGQLPVRVHRSLPLTIRVEGEFIVIDLAKPDEPDSSSGVFNAIPAGMESNDAEERFKHMERQWQRQMAIEHPVAQSEFPGPQRP